MTAAASRPPVVIVGGGFVGLTIAYELAKAGVPVTVVEKDEAPGGIAAGFELAGVRLDRFYHYWYVDNPHVAALVREIGAADHMVLHRTRTDLFYGGKLYRLSTPLDVLRFGPLSLVDRIRLGLVALRAQRVKDYHQLEHTTAAEWLKRLGGEAGYRVVWEPLLRGKFGPYASEVCAAWLWHRLKLRSRSRGKAGAETIAGFTPGFWALVERLVAAIEAAGGTVHLQTPAEALEVQDGRVVAVRAGGQSFPCRHAFITAALPVAADLLEPHAGADYADSLRRITYLANMCLVILSDEPFTGTFWMNVNDPEAPFVALIGHTNFEPPETFGGRHVLYVSSYLPTTHPNYALDDRGFFDLVAPHLARILPAFEPRRVVAYRLWKADYAQPVCVCGYGDLIPAEQTPIEGVRLVTMAQLYPEDRGTNYAVRQGRQAARKLLDEIGVGAAAEEPRPLGSAPTCGPSHAQARRG